MCGIVNVIGVLTQKALYEKTISNLVECVARGLDVDKPRNLAKSVTVE